MNNRILLPLGLKNVSLAKSPFAARNRNEVIPETVRFWAWAVG